MTVRKTIKKSVGEDIEKMKPLYTIGENCGNGNWWQYNGKQ